MQKKLIQLQFKVLFLCISIIFSQTIGILELKSVIAKEMTRDENIEIINKNEALVENIIIINNTPTPLLLASPPNPTPTFTPSPSLTYEIGGDVYSSLFGGANDLAVDIAGANTILAQNNANVTLSSSSSVSWVVNIPEEVDISSTYHMYLINALASSGDNVPILYVNDIVDSDEPGTNYLGVVLEWPGGDRIMIIERGAPPIVFLHETIHTLGLGHTDINGNVMHSNYLNIGNNLTPGQVHQIRSTIP